MTTPSRVPFFTTDCLLLRDLEGHTHYTLMLCSPEKKKKTSEFGKAQSSSYRSTTTTIVSFTPHITEFSPTFPLPLTHTPPSSLAVCTPTLPQLFSASGLQIRPRLSCSSTHACGRSLALFPSTVTSPSLPLLPCCCRCCFSGSRRGKSIALSSKLLLLLQLLSCFLLYRCFSFRLVIRESFLASPWFFFALFRFLLSPSCSAPHSPPITCTAAAGAL